jgi:hypothetical protein
MKITLSDGDTLTIEIEQTEAEFTISYVKGQLKVVKQSGLHGNNIDPDDIKDGDVDDVDGGTLVLWNECQCCNPLYGFDCICSWLKSHPGNIDYNCEHCGIYKASSPRCNKCKSG